MKVWDDGEFMEIYPETEYEGSWIETHLHPGKGLLEFERCEDSLAEDHQPRFYLRVRKSSTRPKK